MNFVGKMAPNFQAQCVLGNSVKEIKLSDYKNKYVFLFFYPLDFTFVCPTELHALQAALTKFRERNVEILACSVDSQFSHMAWLNTPKKDGGIQGIEYGLIADLGGHIARTFDVLNDENVAYRAQFLIDETGIVRHQLVNDLPIGRSIDEALRLVDALQFSQKYGEVCPANWSSGKEAIKPNAESTKAYLEKNA